ncbi:multidrug ABC transporter ATP-binding protein [Thermoanaerobacterium thermosaccharolyticum]|jgi:ABC transporter.|uniref:ABC transporter related protein n=2 Tax=Clostridia TaxID=186801 RepID=A0A078KV53_9FIRM|nr:ABC transporter ATP-binding protein [Thermoanaerobacterium thermosaccharolyticum]AST58401.1 ABC ATP-binding protein [Thermoanaerobacterium thermosaccharolyticum]PHO08219.1 multidrug ABC transporter ATP-binding protein [Thermoanaerobacterium thermosaccharolyticum]PZM89119.1 MAG: ABC transporter ATP-binding protein [[Clostridium] cellulosi]CDZ25055.1 ABC transporter related protein [[Clostridium] cellulosi]
MPYIVFNNVTREYRAGKEKIKALANANFSVEKDSFTIILGPSGSGKSTTLNLLGGMDRATSGQIFVGDKEITALSDKQLTDYRRTDVGFVFQFYNLIPNLNAYENVDVSARLGKNPLDPKKMLSAVGLEKRMKNFPSEMSGGEMQRTSIARALCKNPDLILCDEPTGALDSATGRTILQLLQNIAHNEGKTVVVVTHNSAIAPAADRVIRLKDGHVVQVTDNKNPVSMEEVTW